MPTAVILAGCSVAVMWGALRMPMGGTYAGMPIHWYTSPGFFPLVLGGLLGLCSVSVLVRGCREGALRRLPGRLRWLVAALPRNRIAGRILVIWVLLLGYVLSLAVHPFARISNVFDSVSGPRWLDFLATAEGSNYVFSSFCFLFVFMYLFYFRARPRRSWTGLALLFAMSLLTALGVGYVFTQHLYSPLPW